MFCPSCGTKLDDGSKFCGSCGAEIEASNGDTSSAVVASIALAPLPSGLADCPITITQVNAEGPDDDGGLRVEFRYEVSNETDGDWDYLVTRVQILSASGQVIEETRDTHEQTFDAGESVELEGSFWGVSAKALGPDPEQAHIVINAVACGLSQQAIGQVAIPEASFEVLPLKPTKLGNFLQLVSGSLWKTEPDEDKDARVEIRGLVQNLTRHSLPEVKILVEITDKSGRELTEASGSDEVRPADICLISGSGYCKDKKLKGAKADLALRVYAPVAAGVAQAAGMILTASDASGNADDSSDEEEEEIDASGDEGDEVSATILFRRTVSRFRRDPRNKVFAEFPVLLASAAEETGKAVSEDQLQKVIARFLNGSMTGKDTAIYDGAVAICGQLARECFGDGQDDDVDYELSWIENIDGTFTAELRGG